MEDKDPALSIAAAAEYTTQIQPRRSPHIPRPIDNTALALYMECPRKFFYAMVLHRRKENSAAPALSFGSCWHKAMEAHYKTGGDRTSVEEAIIMGWEPHDKPDDHRTVDRVLTCYDKYLETYGDHNTDCRNNGKTVGYPGNPMVEIPIEIAWPGSLHPYTGKIDRIIEWQGLYFVEDHKTTSRMGDYYFYQFDPDNQMMGYAWLAQLITGLPIAGVRINALAALKTQTKFARELVSYSKERLKEWTDNYNVWIRRVEDSYKTFESLPQSDQPRDPEEVLLSAFPHNFRACAGKYRQCEYTDVCTITPARRAYVLEHEYAERPWNPLETFEEGGEE
jgi:hypothetical protein